MPARDVRVHSGVTAGGDRRLPDLAVGCALFLTYLVVVTWLTWPLAAVAGSMLSSGSGDTLYSLWALERAPGPLLELPVATVPDVSQGMFVRAAYATQHGGAMFRSTYHWHPILNGYSSYFPATFPARMALAAKLPDGHALDALVGQTGVRFLWLHLGQLPDTARERWEREIAGDSGGPVALWVVARQKDDVLIEVARR